jgi:predicted nucleic acid-binding protein
VTSSIPEGPVALDASVALALALEEPLGALAERLLRRLARAPARLMVPVLFDTECANGLARAVRRDRIDRETAASVLADLLDMPAERVSVPSLHREALRLALQFGISVHDAEYVALAGANMGVLVTADAKLARALTGSGHDLLLLQDLDLS